MILRIELSPCMRAEQSWHWRPPAWHLWLGFSKPNQSYHHKDFATVMEWQSRPLDSIYPIVFLMESLKSEKTAVLSTNASTLLGWYGRQKGYIGHMVSENESASFGQVCVMTWKTVVLQTSNRLPTTFQAFHRQLQQPSRKRTAALYHTPIRNSTKYVSYKDLKPLMADLKLVYGAPTLDDAEYRLEEFAEKWDCKYPQIAKSWRENGRSYPPISSVRGSRNWFPTNAVEGFHGCRKYTKTKTVYDRWSCQKIVYLSIQEITKNGDAYQRLGHNNRTTYDIFWRKIQQDGMTGLCPEPRGLWRLALPVIRKSDDQVLTVQSSYKAQQASGVHLCIAHIYAVTIVFTH